MQHFRILTLITCVTCMVLLPATPAAAQIPQTMSYQGVLTDGAGDPLPDGSYSLTFRLYTVASAGTAIWTETQSLSVTSGVFSVILGALTPLAMPFDQPYWLGLSVDGGPEFSPRTELTATAYSLNSRSVADSAVTGSGIAAGTVVRSLSGLSDDVILAAGSNVSISTSGDSLIVSASGGGGSLDWSLTGNAGTTPGVNFLGTTDNQPLELWVNGARALRVEPNPNSPSIVGGYSGNAISAGAEGVVIAGGGAAAVENTASDHHGTVGGGRRNAVGDGDGDPATAAYATVAGGNLNRASATATAVGGGDSNVAGNEYATVGGGISNNASGYAATIGGGEENLAGGVDGTVGGGSANDASGQTATIGGGNGNTASGQSSTVAGGNLNTASGLQSTISGGNQNSAAVWGAVIGGGETNNANGEFSVIGGGLDNTTQQHGATVGGGDGCTASGMLSSVLGGNMNTASGWSAAVGGGQLNLASGMYSTIAGGESNIAAGGYSFAAGRGAQALHSGAFVWSDSTGDSGSNTFTSTGSDQFLIRAAGGVGIGTNTPQQELDVAGSVRMIGFDLPTGAAAGYVLTSDVNGQGSWQPAPGGSAWGLAGNAGTAPGTNFLGTTDNVAIELRANSSRALMLVPHTTSPSVVAGHASNQVNAAAWGQTIAGGGEFINANAVTDVFGTVGGGAGNQAGNNDGSPTNSSYATVAGGIDNVAFNEYSFIGGGNANTTLGSYSVIAGGNGNSTSNARAFIGGGENNQVAATGGVVGGGLANQAANNYTTVGGGNGNTASGIYSTVGGGFTGTASGESATVAGGTQNQALGRATCVGGGDGNQAFDRGGTVAGGWNNRAWGVMSTIAGGGRMNLADGGTANRVTDDYGTVGGGGNNQAGNGQIPTTDAQFATVGGGRQNQATGAQSTVAGGNFNGAGGTNATVAGGTSNNATGLNAAVGGGASNLASASNASVGGGLLNQATGSYGSVAGGYGNVAQGIYSAVPGGRDNYAGGIYSLAAGYRAIIDTLHGGTFLFADGNNFDFASQSVNEFAARATGGVRFVTGVDGSGTPVSGVELAAGSGTWASLSDRNAKENITPVDGAAILAKLDRLEIATWSYRSEDPSVQHMGPMAQDFYLAFRLGADDRHITTVDADGVSLAAVQALNRKLTRELEERDAQISALEGRLAALEVLVTRMAGAPAVTH